MSLTASPTAALDAQASARQLLDADIPRPQPDAFQGHGFVIGNLGFLLPSDLACEVMDQLHICPLPGTAGWLLGMTHLRGRILPVFDLRQLVTDRAKADRVQRYLFIDPQDQGFALGIGSLPFRIKLQEHQRLSHTTGVPDLLLPHSRNLFHHERVWIELDYKSFFRQQSQRLLGH